MIVYVTKNFPILISIMIQRVKESVFISETTYSVMLLVGHFIYMTPQKRLGFRLISQVHRSSRSAFLRTVAFRNIKKSLSLHSNITNPRLSVEQFKANIGSRIICIKPRVSNLEKGVLLIKYSESMSLLPFFCNMDRLLQDYTLVFEPSWSGYCTSELLHYASYTQDVFFQAKQRDDFEFLTKLNCNLKPLRMGPCDWVDPAISLPFINSDKDYDIVFNSNWSAPKRHQALFKALSKIPSTLKVALIGFEWGGRTKQDILNLAKFYNVENQIVIFEKVSFNEVMKINSSSKVAVLLSLKEGSNRAIAESLFCDTPAIVLKNHIGGIVENITPQTGKLVEESKLGSEIMDMLRSLRAYTPRDWALKNISCYETTKSLNQRLRTHALSNGEKWSIDITVKTNSPDLGYMNYVKSADCISENEVLENYMKKR
jgi:glycosyltransferase involved in cell wall biosynthesis